MNSSSYLLLDSGLKMLFDNLDILGEQHIASIEFTVSQEKGPKTSLKVNILCLPKGKKNQIP